MKTTLKLTMMLATVALLGACGGGGGNDNPPPPPPAPPPPDPLAAVPDAAKQSTDGLVIYLKTLSLQASDSREAITLDLTTLPTSDSADPQPL